MTKLSYQLNFRIRKINIIIATTRNFDLVDKILSTQGELYIRGLVFFSRVPKRIIPPVNQVILLVAEAS